MAGKVEARKEDGLIIYFERKVGDTVPSSLDTSYIRVSITQHEANQLIKRMQEAIRWINFDQQIAEWEWGKD